MALARKDLPELSRITDYLYFHAERMPDHEFAVSDGTRITYGEAAEQVSALSRALLARGIQPGDRVATLSTPRPEFLISFLATVDIGAMWVGLNPKYQLRELQHVVDNSQPRLILGLTRYRNQDLTPSLQTLAETEGVEETFSIGAHVSGMDSFEDLIESGREIPDDQRLVARESSGGTQPALLVYTSGTTGAPKGAVLTHRSLCWSFLRQAQRWDPGEMRLICNLPIDHSGCVGDNVSTCLIAGGTVLLMEEFDPDGMLELIPKERVDSLMQIPTQYQLLAGRPGFDEADLSSLKLVSWGGAAMARPVIERYLALGVRAQVVYGLTESPASLTFSEKDADIEQLTETVGRPDPEIEFRLMNHEGVESVTGESGEVQVRHDSSFAGYFNNPEATKEAFTDDGFLKTGDLGIEREDGYIKLVGRLKEMYKSGGYNVYPREIEMVLERHPAVSTAVVVGIPDPVWSEVGAAFVVEGGGQSATPGELTEWCRKELANYKVPKSITILPELPLLPIGKPDKRALRAIAEDAANEKAA